MKAQLGLAVVCQLARFRGCRHNRLTGIRARLFTHFILSMKLLRAFLIRDFYTETSYRVAFLVGLVGTLFRLFIFYFLSRLVGDGATAVLQEYEGDYFSFVIIGIAFGGYFGVGLTSFAQALRQSQTTGTLEAMLVTPTPVSWIIIGSAAWSYTYTTFRVLVYLLAGRFIFGLNLSDANYLAAAVILVLSIISFASIGIAAASVIMVIKRGDPMTALISNMATLIGGVYYPVEILPGWLQTIAGLLPITYGLRAMRLALIAGASWPELAPDLLALSLFCLTLFPVSLLLFRRAVDLARSDGSLTHY
jgi:ABC-2 type transport system permease protein